MQKRKSLLLKVLSLVLVLSCAMVAVFSVACSSNPTAIKSVAVENGLLVFTLNNGEKVSQGKGIKSMTGSNGKLVLTLDDNTTQEVNVVASTCQHNFVSQDIKHANCIEKGLVASVCTNCKGVKIEETSVDPEVHGRLEYEKSATTVEFTNGMITKTVGYVFHPFDTKDGNTTQPTCLDDGTIETCCKECGAVIKTEHQAALGHDFVELTGDIDNDCSCVTGTVTVRACSRCQELDTTFTPIYSITSNEHVADDTWTVVTEPTKLTEGLIHGVCVNCGCEHDIELPKFTDPAYAHVMPTCASPVGSKETYTLTNYKGFTHTFEFDYQCTHKIEEGSDVGYFIAFNENLPIDGQITYTWEDVAPFFATNRLLWNEGFVPNCQGASLAVFGCDDCGAAIVIRTSGEHTYAADYDKDENGNYISSPATCSEAGWSQQKTCTCEGCGHVEKFGIIGKLLHTYAPVNNAEYDEDTNKVTILVACENCGESDEGNVDVLDCTFVSWADEENNVATYTYMLNGVPTNIDVDVSDSVVELTVINSTPSAGYKFNVICRLVDGKILSVVEDSIIPAN